MTDALIGFTGYVGSTLVRQRQFEARFNSANIAQVEGRSFDIVVCAGAAAQKWVANRDPESDREKIATLIRHLETIKCKTFVLVSTVDVFANPFGVDETAPVDNAELHPYGRHRRMLERFVEERFPDRLVVRLPGLVGPGLRKNVIYDFHHRNNLGAIDARSVFQFYPMVNLWHDLAIGIQARLRLLHLTAEPIGVAQVAREGFGVEFDQELPGQAATYDMRTIHAEKFGSTGAYQYTRRESLMAIRAYAQSEPGAERAIGVGPA